MSDSPDIVVVGAGLSGLMAALALSADAPGAGARVILLDAGDIDRAPADARTTALAPSTVRMLRSLGVAMPESGAMLGMRVGEGEADSPWQFELPARSDAPLAFVIGNADLRAALLRRLDAVCVPRIGGSRVTALSMEGRARLDLDTGETLAPMLVVAADGRDSAVRRMAGLSVSRLDFGQHALVCTVRHAEDHEGIALQRFQPVGAVASLPLAHPNRSQIIWSDRSASVRAAAQLSPGALAALIDSRLWGALEVTSVEGTPHTYPLLAQRAEALSAERVALVGDAARVIHPLAGQGFNLAARDIAALAETVGAARATGQDLGTAGLLGYQRWRRTDETVLGTLTSALSAAPRGMSQLSRLVGHARRAAFAATDALPVLHPFIRQEAAGETGTQPALLL